MCTAEPGGSDTKAINVGCTINRVVMDRVGLNEAGIDASGSRVQKQEHMCTEKPSGSETKLINVGCTINQVGSKQADIDAPEDMCKEKPGGSDTKARNVGCTIDRMG